MRTMEYRDLIDSVFEQVASCKSAATHEFATECQVLQRRLDELRAANAPRANIRDQTRAANAQIAAQDIIKQRLWAEYDNQHIEEMERQVRQ